MPTAMSEPPPLMRTASATTVEPKWLREDSAGRDEEWSPSGCVRRTQSGSSPVDSGSESVFQPVGKDEIKIEVHSPKVERPSSPSASDDDPLSDRAAQSLVRKEVFRCRSPSPSEDFIGFTEVDRDNACYISNAKRSLLLRDQSDIRDSAEVFAEGVSIDSQRFVINYRDVAGLDDGNIFCDVCCRDLDGECRIHGALKVISDTKARPGIGDSERDVKTLPPSLSSAQSRNPVSGTGVWTEKDVPARQRLGPYEGTLTTEQARARTPGYKWQIRKGQRVHHLVNTEDPSCSNWLRRVNCARSEEEQNLVAFQYRGQIYFRTSKPIPRGSELLVYYGDESARELTVHSETSGEAVTSSSAGPSSSGIGGPLQCLHCNYRCLGQDRLDTHVKRVHGNIGRNGRHYCEWCLYSTNRLNSFSSSVQCPHCDSRCLGPKHLDRHDKSRHSHTGRNGRFKCEWCQYSTDDSSSIKCHRRIHTGERPHRCDICDKTFAQQRQLTIHRRIHTGQRPYKCDVCKKSSRQTSAPTRHRLVHTGEKTHQCEQCAATSTQLSTYKVHMKIHQGVKQYGCHVCSARFIGRSDLMAHLSSHTGNQPFGCSICPLRFTQRSKLTEHLRTHTGERPYGCSICPTRFTQRGHLTRHMRIHTGERPYNCSICTARFADRASLNRHMRTHTGEQPYKCSICTARFTQLGTLTTHMRIHSGNQPHGCSICPARFTQRGHLTRHMRIHTGERPYNCSICPARFTERSKLVEHMRTHTGERPYGCSVCTARFIKRGALKTHMLIHSGERPFGCSICPARFATRSGLNRHMRTHTGRR
ncbi:zinc finger protein 271-like isoform X2 [Amphibalanus amphitrite]|nr:zinc finger protein 271-like isoform X2 [Amphibalanus amphitrite]XP_043223717.1 zinc finger protein 271-like isoform X2 [Amphibalanus amphitrite]XP_043223718.1 zinc finger protein 271-like isoform X2 [Amphibalanus amphitrite]